MSALVPLALAGWLATGAPAYHFLDDNGEPFSLRAPSVDLTPARLPAGILLLPTPP